MKINKKKSEKLKLQTETPPMKEASSKACDQASIDTEDELKYFVYTMTKEEIEACDISCLVHHLRPDLHNPLFAVGPGRVIFLIEGYGDTRGFLMTSEFRAFVLKAEQEGVCWLYFAAPAGSQLRTIMVTRNGTATLKRKFGSQQLIIQLDMGEVHQFLNRQMRNFRRFCKMAKTDREEADLHLQAVIEDSFPNLPLI